MCLNWVHFESLQWNRWCEANCFAMEYKGDFFTDQLFWPFMHPGHTHWDTVTLLRLVFQKRSFESFFCWTTITALLRAKKIFYFPSFMLRGGLNRWAGEHNFIFIFIFGPYLVNSTFYMFYLIEWFTLLAPRRFKTTVFDNKEISLLLS